MKVEGETGTNRLRMTSPSFVQHLSTPRLLDDPCLLLENRRTKEANPIVVVVDGEIAAGKSTLTELAAQWLNEGGIEAVHIQEPVQVWKDVGILQAFYKDQKKYAYKFQTFVFVTRVEEVLRKFNEAPNADVYLLDRSIFTDAYVFMNMLAQDGVLEDVDRTMYLQWWHLWANVMPLVPSAFLYHKPSIEMCMQNHARRGREGEVFPEVYQRKLRKAHEEFFKDGKVLVGEKADGTQVFAPVYINEDDRNIYEDKEYQEKLVGLFMEMIAKCSETALSMGEKLKMRPVIELEARVGVVCNGAH